MKRIFKIDFSKIIFVSWISLQSLYASDTNYCLAVRGNGELMPAHWGAFSSLIQKKGMPIAMAGGSSGSISIFLLESLAMNQMARTNSEKALLVKSFQGYFEAMAKTPEGRAVKALLADKDIFMKLAAEVGKNEQVETSLKNMLLLKKHLRSVESLLNSKNLLGLINPEFLTYVRDTIHLTESLERGGKGVTIRQVDYRRNQITNGINNFGKFNAETDETLFFRPGLINFNYLATFIGKMADFYAGIELRNKNIQKKVQKNMSDFLNACTPGTAELTWGQLTTQKPVCKNILTRAILTYQAEMERSGDESLRINEAIGTHVASFPATSIITGEAVKNYRKMKAQYLVNEDPRFGSTFKVEQKNLHFGYWGNPSLLKKIELNLRSDQLTANDEKSKKFFNLGKATWLEALSSSPAEPGLSNLVSLNANLISAGGWSDLHPTLFLRAYGCADIVYLTRRGGETIFGQGAMKKLTDIEGFNWEDWQGLSKEERKNKNARGNSSDVGAYATLWSKLYNMANPESSIRKSMSIATTVICTNWDSFDVSKELNALVEDGFHAPWLTNPKEICR